MPRGGRRPGAGRKPKTVVEKQIEGTSRADRGRVLEHPASGQVPVVAPIDEFDVPDTLTLKERQVWLDLAPHAFANRTLTKATRLSFELLCRNVVLERKLSADVELVGGPNHRGLIQRVDSELSAFNLRPFGKPIYEEAPKAEPVNPLEKFLRKTG